MLAWWFGTGKFGALCVLAALRTVGADLAAPVGFGRAPLAAAAAARAARLQALRVRRRDGPVRQPRRRVAPASSLAGPRSWRHNLLRDDCVLAPCKQVGNPAYREEPDNADGTRDRLADAWTPGVELEPAPEPTQSEVCADVTVVASTMVHLASGADLRPGAVLAAGFNRKLGNVQKLELTAWFSCPSWHRVRGGFPQRLGHPYKTLDTLAAARGGA